MSMLVTLVLAAPPVLWRFPADADAAPTAVEAAVAPLTAKLPDHLVTGAQRAAWLAAPAPTPAPALPPCFVDLAACPQPERAALEALGLSGRIDARAQRRDTQWTLRLDWTSSAQSTAPRTLVGQGATLQQAAENVVAELAGQATVRVLVEPASAKVYAGAVLLGEGAGTYAVPPGALDVRAEAEGFAPATVKVDLTAGDAADLTFKLPAVSAYVNLRLNPESARVTLDHLPFSSGTGKHALAPGAHLLRAEAEGFEAFERRVDIKAGETLDIVFDMTPKADLSARYARPHPDALAKALYVRGALRTSRVSAGKLGLGSGLLRAEKTTDAAEIGGLDLGVGWRGELLEVEALGLAWLGGADAHGAALPQDRAGLVEDLQRLVLRPAWVGVRWPRWRVDPYARLGVSAVVESLTIRGVLDTTGGRKASEQTHLLWMVGGELGCRAQIDDAWFAQLSGSYEGVGADRPQASFQVGLGWAFDALGFAGGGAR